MASRTSMEQLVEMAKKKVDQAAKALAARHARERDAEAKLELLVTYRTDYSSRYGDAAAAGMENHLLHNFRAFMHKLEAAIAEQQAVLAEARAKARSARAQWQAEQQRLKSYLVLADRRRGSERALQAKRDQREQDEHAAKAHARHRASA